jgi:broad specificity phosphatase PhoE
VKFILIRHGETDWNRFGKFQGQNDIPLNRLGIEQARLTGKAISSLHPNFLYSSTLCRALQFAEQVSQILNLPVIKKDGFNELNLGDLDGATGQEMRTRWPDVHEAWQTDPASVVMPNGESLTQLQLRASRNILTLRSPQNEHETAIIVSHNFTIRTIIAHLLGMPLSNLHRLPLALASICIVEHNQNGRSLITYNSTHHLSPMKS